MSVTKTTTKIGIEDANIAAAGGTFSRTRVVNGSTTTGTVSYFNASSFPFTTANQSTITGAGWTATNPSAFAAELGPVLAASVANAAALQAITWTPTAGQSVIVRDIKRVFLWDSASTTAEDGVSVIKVTAITTGRWLSTAAYLADLATAANGLKTATNTVSISAATAPTTYQVLKATGAALATWQDDVARGVKSATTSIDLAAATAPTTGQILTATGASAATWQDNNAIGLKSATTNVGVSAATAPSANQVLRATSSTAATWQDLSSTAGKVVGSDTSTSIAASGTLAITCAVGTGKVGAIFVLSNATTSSGFNGDDGQIGYCTTTNTDTKTLFYDNGATANSGIFSGSTNLGRAVYGGGDIYLQSAVYDSGTGNVTLTFKNNDGVSSTTIGVYYTVVGF